MFDQLFEEISVVEMNRLPEIISPRKRPDGALVTDDPDPGSIPYKRGLKKGDKVTASYHDPSRKFVRVSGVVYGFTRDDAMILDTASQDFYWIDAKNVFRK